MKTGRAQIVDLLAKNTDLLAPNLRSVWQRSAEDLIASGIERETVLDSLFTVALAMRLQVSGTAPTAEYLRDLAGTMEEAVIHSRPAVAH